METSLFSTTFLPPDTIPKDKKERAADFLTGWWRIASGQRVVKVEVLESGEYSATELPNSSVARGFLIAGACTVVGALIMGTFAALGALIRKASSDPEHSSWQKTRTLVAQIKPLAIEEALPRRTSEVASPLLGGHEREEGGGGAAAIGGEEAAVAERREEVDVQQKMTQWTCLGGSGDSRVLRKKAVGLMQQEWGESFTTALRKRGEEGSKDWLSRHQDWQDFLKAKGMDVEAAWQQMTNPLQGGVAWPLQKELVQVHPPTPLPSREIQQGVPAEVPPPVLALPPASSQEEKQRAIREQLSKWCQPVQEAVGSEEYARRARYRKEICRIIEESVPSLEMISRLNAEMVQDLLRGKRREVFEATRQAGISDLWQLMTDRLQGGRLWPFPQESTVKDMSKMAPKRTLSPQEARRAVGRWTNQNSDAHAHSLIQQKLALWSSRGSQENIALRRKVLTILLKAGVNFADMDGEAVQTWLREHRKEVSAAIGQVSITALWSVITDPLQGGSPWPFPTPFQSKYLKKGRELITRLLFNPKEPVDCASLTVDQLVDWLKGQKEWEDFLFQLPSSDRFVNLDQLHQSFCHQLFSSSRSAVPWPFL